MWGVAQEGSLQTLLKRVASEMVTCKPNMRDASKKLVVACKPYTSGWVAREGDNILIINWLVDTLIVISILIQVTWATCDPGKFLILS